MTQYIALLRGINVGGNNKVPMQELKALFEANGYLSVLTYINSGNVLFFSEETDTETIKSRCEKMIADRFGFPITVMIIGAAELCDALQHAPDWWGVGADVKHNALFIIPPATPEEVMREIGEAKPEYERVAYHGKIIFWSAPVKTFSRTRYAGIVGSRVYGSVTIRNANTARKLAGLCIRNQL